MASPIAHLPSAQTLRIGQRKIMVTGGKGTLAVAIAPQLNDIGELLLTDLAPPEGNGESEGYRQADLMNFPRVVDVMRGMDTVVHLAVVAAKFYRERPPLGPADLDPYHEKMLQVNPVIAYHVFEAARRAGVRRVVYASSLTIYYGDKTRPHYQESDPPDPQNLYACTKLFGENLARMYHRDFGLETLSLRIGQPYPSHSAQDPLWRTSRRARSSYVTLEDIGRAVAAAVTSPETSGIFNVVSDSDNPRFDLTASRRMGYVPSGRFTQEGLWHRSHEHEDWVMVSPTLPGGGEP